MHESLSAEVEALSAEVEALRQEAVRLRKLLRHHDCASA